MTLAAVVVLVLGERDQHQSEHTQYQQPFKLVQVDLVQLKMLLVVCLLMHILQELHLTLEHQSLLLLAVVEPVSAATVKLVVLLVVEEVVVLHQVVVLDLVYHGLVLHHKIHPQLVGVMMVEMVVVWVAAAVVPVVMDIMEMLHHQQTQVSVV